MKPARLAHAALLVATVALPIAGQQTPASFDLLIRHGRVLDGTGNPWFPADIGVRDGRIIFVGRAAGDAKATRVIDAAGKYVSPGFIDIHSHADDGSSPRGGFRDANAQIRAAPNLVTQGITTVVVNQDGRSPWPIREQRDQIVKNTIGPNTMLLVGHGAVRRQVMGNDTRRPATADEVAKMRALVRQALEEGAVGMSAGLEYEPGRWSMTDELVELAKELPAVDGVYISHERSEGSDPLWYVPSQDGPGPPTLLDAVRETIRIGEESGARVVASHIKAKGANYWGSSGAAVSLIERARERGVDVWADQYPYPTSGTDGSTVLIPAWSTRAASGGGRGGGRGDVSGAGRGAGQPSMSRAEALRATLADPSLARQVRSDIAHEIARRGGADQVVIFDYTDKALYGKSLAEIARLWKIDPVEAAIQIQMEGLPNRAGGARMRGFSMDERDMELFARQPWIATSTDAGIALPTDGPTTHARFYGSFPRKIRHYAIERGAITLEHAIRSSTSLPARIMGLTDRGLIREGMAADLVVFDLNTIRDKATFFEPHQYSEGVDYVFVNGVAVVDGSKITWALPGQVMSGRER
ncbi:MAG TPA: amidohydrolase family protein [Vicinamibacterales bacterium]|nr:amidohydrolase family protein [Vicinamibacterales bacterium]